MPDREKTSTVSLRSLKGKRGIAALTAYDRITAGWADQAGADLILVGDSLAMTALGYSSTLPATADIMAHHTAAVAAARPKSLVVTDVPFAEAHQGIPHLVSTCANFLRRGAEAVKIEGGENMVPEIKALIRAGIPVFGHIGLLPQQIMHLGRYRKFGTTPEERETILKDGKAVQDAGAFALVAEMVDPNVARELTHSLSIPVIGIGSGTECDGQILVTTDVLGLTPGKPPSFVKVRVDGASLMVEALRGYVQDSTQPSPGGEK